MIMAVHWTFEISAPRARTMMSAVMKITPERTSAMVPGSANLYATKICLWFGHYAYNNANFANPYLFSTLTIPKLLT